MSGELAGALNERLTLLVRVTTCDDLGGASGGWIAGATIWAAVRPDGAGAEGAGDAPGADRRWRATVRSPSAVASQDRVRWCGRILHVRRVEADPVLPDRVTWYLEEQR